jgi:hypothetical protein
VDKAKHQRGPCGLHGPVSEIHLQERVAHALVRGRHMGAVLATDGSGNTHEQGGGVRVWMTS